MFVVVVVVVADPHCSLVSVFSYFRLTRFFGYVFFDTGRLNSPCVRAAERASFTEATK